MKLSQQFTFTGFNLMRWTLLFFVGLTLLLPTRPAHADIGPKPTMKFSFEYQNTPSVSIIEGQLIECQDKNCTSGQPLQKIGPQNFTCTASECSSIAYGYAPYHKLIIKFTDRTRESNVFQKRALNATFKVTVLESSLKVEETSSPIGYPCCPSLLLTLILETAIASAYLGSFHLPKAVLAWIPLSSILSLPIVWFVFPLLPMSAGWIAALSETFAVLFEAGLVYTVARRLIPLRHIAILSLLMNAVSFLFGLLV